MAALMGEKAQESPIPNEKKILIPRAGTVGGTLPRLDIRNMRTWRYIVQILFTLLNLYLGVSFYFWVRYYETGAMDIAPPRPDGIEGWLPIAGLMNLKYFLSTWDIPPIHATAMFLLVAFLLASLLLKKAFCSWLCPIGTLSEAAWRMGQHFFGRSFNPPRWLDIPLRALKYLLLAPFLYIAISMSPPEIESFLKSPYGLIADIKMMNFFRYIGSTALIVLAALLAGSFFVQNLWCRYLCPYGTLMGLASLFSPYKVRRDANACIDCGKCARACPARLPVDIRLQIRSVECTACMSCVEACPVQDALLFALPPGKPAGNGDAEGIRQRWRGRSLSGIGVALALLLIVGGIIAAAKSSGHWETRVTDAAYKRLIPHAYQLRHP